MKKQSLNILLTGGTGYIGSHTAVSLLAAGHRVFLFDNLSNSKISVLSRLEKITGQSIPFIQGDVRDTSLLVAQLKTHKIDAVIHFAGLKAVGESVTDPVRYYDNNVGGTASLLKAMQEVGVHRLVFSSSATVYGTPQYLPYDEDHPTSAVNPYGRTKLHIEEMLRDLVNADSRWSVTILRYFNPVGAHDSGLIGEDPQGIPNNLMPYLTKVAAGELPQLSIFGDDYATEDGTCERDFIHVMDLADGHLAALDHLEPGCAHYNLGTGAPVSVLNLVNAFKDVTGQAIHYQMSPRREGDLPAYYANPSKAQQMLGWKAVRSLDDICRSAWIWQKNDKVSA